MHEVIRINTSRKLSITPYYIYGKDFVVTTKAKYLGVTISNNLWWNHYIDTICYKKANNTTAFWRSNLSSCPTSIKDRCYKTLVRPQVEYASTVWDPHTKKNIGKIEAVQRRAAKFVTANYSTTSSVTTMLDRLEWESLRQRRIRAKATMMYRIVHSLVAIELPPKFSQTGAATSIIPVQDPILPHHHLCRIILFNYHQDVEPAARRRHYRKVPGVIQDQDPGIWITIVHGGSTCFYQFF